MTFDPASDDSVRTWLLARREELIALAASVAADSKPVELDQSRVGRLSRMDALQSQAMSQEIARRRNAELQRLDTAMKRLDDGEYGTCVICGENIPVKRLELDPTVASCTACRG